MSSTGGGSGGNEGCHTYAEIVTLASSPLRIPLRAPRLMGGRLGSPSLPLLGHPCRPEQPLLASNGGLGSDPAVVVVGLGSLSLPPAASGGMIPAEVWSVQDDNDDQCDDKRTPGKLEAPLLGASSVSTCVDPSAVASFEVEESWVQVGRGRHACRGAPAKTSREGLERSLAFKRWDRGRCFRCLERGHQVSACCELFRCIRCRRPGHRERFCRARSPVARDHSPPARASSPVTRAPDK